MLKLDSMDSPSILGFSLPLIRGNFYNNGASPWSSEISLGTPPQPLKFNFDTGSNFIWVTSELCGEHGCTHAADGQFHFKKSTSFKWVSHEVTTQDFGPWGEMEVETGQDAFHLIPTEYTVTSDVFLAKQYLSPSFEGLEWDGGIGVPSSYGNFAESSNNAGSNVAYRGHKHSASANCTAPSFTFFPDLIKNNIISSDQPYVTFSTNDNNDQGEVAFGQLDETFKASREYLFLPWEKYSIESLSYIWTTQLKSLSVGKEELLSSDSKDTFFSLDSGSSGFKGDSSSMQRAFDLTTENKKDVTIQLSQTETGEIGELVVPASTYLVEIQGGEEKGEIISQFEPMDGIDRLVLVGSVLMDHLYTVYEYDVVSTEPDVTLKPVGMWIFNKPNGLKIIQNTQSAPARIFS